MWLNVLWRRWFGRTRPFPSHLRRRRPARQRPRIGPRLEVLEDRTLLSAPGDWSFGNVKVSPESEGGSVSKTGIFLGGTFNNVGGQVGGTSNGFGAQLNLNLSGKVGLDLGYQASSGGQVGVSYQGVKLQQNYAEPTQFSQNVVFTPQNTNVSYTGGSFSTTGPSASVSAGLDANINGSIGGTIAFFKSYSNSVNFNTGAVNQQLINFGIGSDTTSNDLGLTLGLLGTDVSSYLNTLASTPVLSLKVNPAGPEVPVFVEGDLTGSTLPFAAHEDLKLGAGEAFGNEDVGGAISLGSMDEFAPDLSLSSNSLQSGGVLSAAGQGEIAGLNLQMGPLVGTLLSSLGFDSGSTLAALGEDTFSVGPASVTFTPVGFTMGPALYLAQSSTVTPTPQLTYKFSDTSGNAMNADVTKDGQDLGPVSSVTFNPGEDAVGIGFTGTPILVKPSMTFGAQYNLELDLNVDLQGTLTAGQASVAFGPLASPSIGPAYSQSFDFANYKLATVYDNTFTLFTTAPQTLPSFVIGSTFNPSLTVTSFADNNTSGSGSLRFAVESANSLASQSTGSAEQIIHLGPGTYNLSIPPGDGIGQSGALAIGLANGPNGLMSVPTNLVIEGAGAGQAIIQGLPSLGDRLFSVNGGANLTLEGVTLEGGNASVDAAGGGVYNSGALTVSDSTITGNTASSHGGGIDNEGTATIRNSTISDNTESAINGGGGGIYNGPSGTLTVTNSTIAGNLADGDGSGIENYGTATVTSSTIANNSLSSGQESYEGGGVFNSGTLTVANSTISGNHTFAYGGGIFDQNGMATVSNSTIYGNSATDGGGIFTTDNGKLTVTNSTLSGNAAVYGGGVYLNGPPALLDDTIVALNGGSDIYCGPASSISASSLNNLIGTAAGVSGIANGSNGNQVGVANPGLGTFGYYGGPTQTVPLLPGSPAIDAGTSNVSGGLPSTDQRGLSRTINGTLDIGAVEYQYDLGVSGFVTVGSAPGTVQYVYAVTNNGPDAAAGVTLTVPLSSGVVFLSQTLPTGWVETDPGAGNNGTVTFSGNLNSGQSAVFTITAQLQNTAAGAILSNTAAVGPNSWDNNLQNNSVTLTVVNEQEGQALNAVKLFHFTDPNPKLIANDFTASVGWGDGSGNVSGDGSGAVRVVANPNGGFDVLGSHTYAEEGHYTIAVGVSGLDGTTLSSSSQQLFAVADAPLTAVALTPPSNATVNQAITKSVLFHFTDADPTGTASDYTATVTWGDGTSNSSSDGTGTVSVIADPTGGFDVIGSHTYAQIVNPGTFKVQVSDAGGSSTSASVGNFQVLYPDQPLTAGALNVPSVTTEGQSISKQVLFHFSDADPNAQASDYLAAVTWGDGTFNNSNDSSGSVSVAANANGGFDVVGSHVYSEGSGNYFAVEVTDLGDSASTNPDLGGQSTGAVSSAPLTITDPPVVVTAGPTFTGSKNTLSAVQTIAAFTDPGGPEPSLSVAPYLATIQWGDGTITVATLTAQANYAQASVNSQGHVVGQLVSATNAPGIVLASDGKTFSVNLAHQYANGGAYTITTTILHDGIASGPVTTQAAVADQVTATGGFSIKGNAGVSTGSQAVATFTDPAGAGPVSDYSASIDWGDGTSSQPDITSGVISYSAATGVFTVSGAHAYANVGAYPITVVIENFNAYPVTVSSTASIAPATPTVTVSDAGGTYNGNPFPATGKAVGVDGKTTVAGAFTYAYYVGTSAAGTSSATAPSNAGTYTVAATFTGSDPNYTGGTAQTTFTIGKATTALSILAGQQIIVGTAATTVSGQLTSATIVPVGQSVAIALNGVTQSAPVGADGAFSVSFDTGKLGVGKYTISYAYTGDANFDAASAIGSLTVDYGTQLLFNNTKPVHAGRDLHIKLELTDAGGTDVSSSSITVTAVSLVGPNGNPVSLKSVEDNDPNDEFHYERIHRHHHHDEVNGYVFNLDTKGLAAGTFTLYYMAGNDPTLHSLTFVVDSGHDKD